MEKGRKNEIKAKADWAVSGFSIPDTGNWKDQNKHEYIPHDKMCGVVIFKILFS